MKSEQESNTSPADKYARWREEIVKAEKELDKFHTAGRKVNRRFLDDREGASNDGDRKFNIFTANVGILESVLYAKIPKVTISRRFAQQQDQPARLAALILQRVILAENCDFDTAMKQATQDRLIPGLGQAWLRLETDTEELTEISPEDGKVFTYEQITNQEVKVDHVHWSDFLYSPCRTWEERRWVARRVYMSTDALTKRFGAEKAAVIPLDYKPDDEEGSPTEEVFQQATIYEIWDRTTKNVLWLSKGYEVILDEKPNPLQLEDFDPCPRPLVGLCTTSKFIPKSDFSIYQDQYNELDDVNNRISLLVSACKVVGVYDSSATGLQKVFQEGTENTLVPVDNWALFAEKGGIKGQVDWVPLDTVIQALDRLRQSRDDIKGQIYELTGISDIVRGNTKASETLGAQNLKAQFASTRIQKLQTEVAEFAQAILQLKTEMLCRHVAPEMLLKMANIEYSPDGQNAELINAALQLIKGDHETFEWRVKVQADSLGQIDYQEQKQEKVELINAVATFLQSAATTLKAIPPAAPMLFQTLKFALSGFRGSAEMEPIIEQGISAIMKDMEEQKQKAAQTPPPEVQKAQMEMQVAQQELQLKQQEAQMDMEAKKQAMQLDLQKAMMELKLMLQKSQMEMQVDQKKTEQDIYYSNLQHDLALQQKAKEQKANGEA